MAKKQKDFQEEIKTPGTPPETYRVLNLKEAIQSVPVFNEEGKIDYLHVRLQGRKGQNPPVIQSWQITEQLRNLEKRGFIRIEKI